MLTPDAMLASLPRAILHICQLGCEGLPFDGADRVLTKQKAVICGVVNLQPQHIPCQLVRNVSSVEKGSLCPLRRAAGISHLESGLKAKYNIFALLLTFHQPHYIIPAYLFVVYGHLSAAP